MVMSKENISPDAPFRSGKSGKYKLLAKNVTPKYGKYEYELEDADGKEYKVVAKEHYAAGQLLRCMVSFEIVKAKFVVTDTALCKKQDLAERIPEPPKPNQQTQRDAKLETNAKKITSGTDPTKKQLGDPRHKRVSGMYVLRVASVQQDGSTLTYKVEDANGQLYDIRSKKYFPVGWLVDCWVKVVLTQGGVLKVSVTEINKHVLRPAEPGKKVNVLKHWRADTKSRHDSWLRIPCEGDRFRLIYTPMGNKR